MKKIFFIGFAVLAVLSSCTKISEEKSSNSMTIGATIVSDDTKTHIAAGDDGKYVSTWASTDDIRLVDVTNFEDWDCSTAWIYPTAYKCSYVSATGKTGVFRVPSSFPTDGFTSGHMYVAVAPYTKTAVYGTEGAYKARFTTGDTTTDKLVLASSIEPNQTYVQGNTYGLKDGVVPMIAVIDCSTANAKDNIQFHYTAAVLRIHITNNSTSSPVTVKGIKVTNSASNQSYYLVGESYITVLTETALDNLTYYSWPLRNNKSAKNTVTLDCSNNGNGVVIQANGGTADFGVVISPKAALPITVDLYSDKACTTSNLIKSITTTNTVTMSAGRVYKISGNL